MRILKESLMDDNKAVVKDLLNRHRSEIVGGNLVPAIEEAMQLSDTPTNKVMGMADSAYIILANLLTRELTPQGMVNLLGDQLGKIPDYFFSSSASLGIRGIWPKDLIIPDTVSEVGKQAFNGCKGISNLFIPSSVKIIGSGAFSWNKGLEKITISDGVQKIESFAFAYSTPTDVEVPGSVKTIERESFGCLTNLQNIILHEGVEVIENDSISSGQKKLYITIPDSVKSIGGNPFSCDAMKVTIKCRKGTRAYSWGMQHNKICNVHVIR